MTYMDFTCNLLKKAPVGAPIYTGQVAEKMAEHFTLERKEAAAATAVAFKRIMDGKLIPDLRFYQKGIYYRTISTPFGERGIDREQLVADKYLFPNKGYETGLTFLHRIGLTTQMPKERVIATNMAKECARTDKKLEVVIKPPKAEISAENKDYLQILDALEILDKAPIDAEHPYEIIAEHIREKELRYERLLYFAAHYYNKNTVMQLAHTAGEGEKNK